MQKNILADVWDLQLLSDDDDLIASTTLESGEISFTLDSVDVIGGKGAMLLAKLHSARRIDVSVSEVVFNWSFIQSQLGKTSTKGVVNAMAMPKIYSCVDLDGDGAGVALGLVLDYEPIASESKLTIIKMADGSKLATPAGYTITGKNVTIVGGVAGDKYLVQGYYYATAASAETLVLDSTSFAEGVKAILTTIEISKDEKPVNIVQVQLDEVLPSGNFTINTTTQRQSNATNFTFSAIKPEDSNGELGRIIRIPIPTT